MDGMWGQGAAVRFLNWICELGTRRRESSGLGWKIMSLGFDLWRWIKVTLVQPKDPLSGQW